MALYGPITPQEILESHPRTIDYEHFCECHPYRVVGPEKVPERRFSTLACAARTVVAEGSRFHVECGDFKAMYWDCVKLVESANLDAQINEAKRVFKGVCRP